MTNVPLPRLAALLRANAGGAYGTEAATELLIAHGTWLTRPEFLACVDTWDADYGYLGSCASGQLPEGTAHATVVWDAFPAVADRTACSSSETAILRLAAELAGTDTATPLLELLTGLDDTNGGFVLVAMAIVLRFPRSTQ